MGLECRPRDGVQTSTAESVCQKPLVVDPSVPTCATMLCTATTTCVEDSVNGARCVAGQQPTTDCKAADGTVVADGSSFRLDCNECWCMRGNITCTAKTCNGTAGAAALREGEVCMSGSGTLGKCEMGLECRPRDGCVTVPRLLLLSPFARSHDL
eukprot:TRINITY_DN625_c1_g1_i12.p3 TRINITY_DN625_c1_g1~~TRINITY_DN625_c1_g1_i12.p3  ORF type:complete len:171 (+),score=42.20 TRINITY_DN625_c1_g1_i12:50-514(+)